jgi:hypothetical protein
VRERNQDPEVSEITYMIEEKRVGLRLLHFVFGNLDIDVDMRCYDTK